MIYIEGFIRSGKSGEKHPKEKKVSRSTFGFQNCFI